MLFVTFCAISQLAFAQQTYSFTSLDYPGAASTQCNGINSRGDIVGAYTTSQNTLQAFYRNAEGTFSTLLGGTPAGAYGINDSGVIVGSTIAHGIEAAGFILSKGVVTPLSAPDYATRLTGISANNTIIGTYTPGFTGSYQSFQRVNGKVQQLPLFEGESVLPLGINREGTIVVSGPGGGAFILRPGGTYQEVQYPGDVSPSSLNGINDYGVAVGARNTPSAVGEQGFTYFQGTFNSFLYPGSIQTVPFGISNTGLIVGVYLDATEAFHCFVATPTS